MKISIKDHGDVNAFYACKQMNPNLKELLKIYWLKISLKNQKIPNMKNPLLHKNIILQQLGKC